ncbi:hypothetical protein PHAVU_011G009000 [Phaseolus vulgaris]|uniref:Uncharacterized protein n=1 Tax=Phaseolus vulgaris TaxID=3885 RepID=V7ADR2_PHAVU|nr:hypothetical protein PHAVU_011G009000g [Phaseolus vulgaris]ESW03375.1 hypothetical protein PHAVU_011G009000g [Phaseolus vulgaris]
MHNALFTVLVLGDGTICRYQVGGGTVWHSRLVDNFWARDGLRLAVFLFFSYFHQPFFYHNHNNLDHEIHLNTVYRNFSINI